MHRRAFLLALLSTGLSACGFQPRGMVELPPVLQRVHLGGRLPDRGLASALERLLRQNGGELVSDAREASLRLTVTDYTPGRRQVVLDPRARSREVELTLRLRVKAEDAQGLVLLDNEVFEAARNMHDAPTNVLSRGSEEARLLDELQETIAQAILARLRAAAGR
ncbi:MAG: LPS assembly lipoprotein LptE [Pseudomonadota bacterium]